MKETKLALPELGLIAATRGMLGAGIALLASGKMEEKHRRTVGWTLFSIGALSTIPLILDVVRKIQPSQESESENTPSAPMMTESVPTGLPREFAHPRR